MLSGVQIFKFFVSDHLKCLTKTCNEDKKTQHLEFGKLNESPYLTALSPRTARIIFKVSIYLI